MRYRGSRDGCRACPRCGRGGQCVLRRLHRSGGDVLWRGFDCFAVARSTGARRVRARGDHKEERWRALGWGAARADDVANLIPARIAGTLLAIAGCGGLGVMFKDASKHASPNAGWPEAAMAGALGVRLGGPTSYDGVVH